MDVFQGQDHEGSSQTELEVFRGELLGFIDFRLTRSPNSVDRFWQRLSVVVLVHGAAASSQFPISLQIVLNHNFSYFRVSNCGLAAFFTLFLILETLDEFSLIVDKFIPFSLLIF